jgi:IS1 family transposase
VLDSEGVIVSSARGNGNVSFLISNVDKLIGRKKAFFSVSAVRFVPIHSDIDRGWNVRNEDFPISLSTRDISVVKSRRLSTLNYFRNRIDQDISGWRFSVVSYAHRSHKFITSVVLSLKHVLADSGHIHPGSLIDSQLFRGQVDGILHGKQLEPINSSHHDANDQGPSSNFGVGRFVGWRGIGHEFILFCVWIFLAQYFSRRLICPLNNSALDLLLFILLAVSATHALLGFLNLARRVNTVTHKYLTSCYLCNTVIGMANVLNKDKQIAVIGALAEGSSIRSIERITGVHRDTIMRLGVKVGQGCTSLMDAKMRELDCHRLEFDEIWGFVGKKDRNVRVGDDAELGSVWTFCAIDADTKLVPAFKVGKRDKSTANAFVQDVASRMKNRVQISTDGLSAYVEAIEKSFGADVDFAQIVKTYGREEVSDNRRYSAPEFVSSEKKVITGSPDERLISTSYIERLNATTRLHVRRLTRLTLAFSKKLENFDAAVALHFAYYNFVKRHNSLRCTPAMAAGVEHDFWTVGDLVEAAS